MSDEERRPLLDGDDHESTPSTFGSNLRRLSSSAHPPYDTYSEDSTHDTLSGKSAWTVVPVLLLGVFVANADGSLVIATSPRISGEFDALNNASWLVTSFGLAQCASQPLYGKLSDIFGRKANLAVAYILFAAGCLLCGSGQAYGQVIAGRAVSGIGGAGMTALVSVIITDMVPVRDIASWRSYVNVAATTGRSLGGPVGGWLTDTIGWRWSFNGQAPLTLIGLLLIWWRIPGHEHKGAEEESDDVVHVPLSVKMRRVDVIGATALAITICALLLALDFLAKEAPWYHVLILSLVSVVCGTFFFFVEIRLVREPILPIELLTKRDPLTAYLVPSLQIAAQYAMFYIVPVYFQIVAHTSVAGAGMRLVPAIVGNAIGGLLSGMIIFRIGRYKLLTISASAAATIGYSLVLIRWHGHTRWPELSYFALGGFGAGVLQSTMFVHLAASLETSEMAVAGTTLYLAQNVFSLVGLQLSTTVFRKSLRLFLNSRLEAYDGKTRIIEQALASVKSIWSLPPNLRTIVIQAHVDSMTCTYALSVVLALSAFLLGLTIREKKL